MWKILTVDDDEDIRSSICERLNLEGFDTVWAKNGRVALDYLNATSDEDLPDLIFLDYMMPVMNGKDFCLQKNTIPRLQHIPVVMMTAGGFLVNLMDKLDDVPHGYMSKPLDDETIVGLVKYFLESIPKRSSELTHRIDRNSESMHESLGIDSQT